MSDLVEIPAGRPIWRFTVPVDDAWHELRCGLILHVASRVPDAVEMWAPPGFMPRWFRVIGTAQILDEPTVWRGTAVIGGLVWHVVESGRRESGG